NLANYSYPTSTYTLSLHDALPIYPQFARHPDRHQTEVAVEHVHACVGDGPADGDRSGIGLGGTGHVIAARERGRLRRPIAVDDLGRGKGLGGAADMGHRERFAAHQELLNAPEGLRRRVDDAVEQRTGEPHRGDTVLFDEIA